MYEKKPESNYLPGMPESEKGLVATSGAVIHLDGEDFTELVTRINKLPDEIVSPYAEILSSAVKTLSNGLTTALVDMASEELMDFRQRRKEAREARKNKVVDPIQKAKALAPSLVKLSELERNQVRAFLDAIDKGDVK